MTVAPMTKDQLLGIGLVEEFTIPGVGVVKARPFSAQAYEEADLFARFDDGSRNSAEYAARLCADALVEPAFDDYKELLAMPASRLYAIFAELNTYTGMSDIDHTDEKGAIDQRVDQFPTSGQSDDSDATGDAGDLSGVESPTIPVEEAPGG